jgi:hypothetical protein
VLPSYLRPLVSEFLPPSYQPLLISEFLPLSCLLPFAFWFEPPSSLPHCGLPLHPPRFGAFITSPHTAFDQRLLPALSYFLDCIPNSSRSFFFFVLIRLLRELRTPDLLSRLQALSPNLLLRGALVSSDPSDPELCLFMAVLNFDLVSNLHLASATTQLHTMVADIESMREMAIFTPGDPESHWHDRFGSLRPPFPFPKSRMFHAHSE